MKAKEWMIRLSIFVIFAVAFVFTLRSLLLSRGDTTALATMTGILVGALVLVAVLPRLADFAIGPAGLTARLNQVEEKERSLRSDIQAIRILLKVIVSKYEIDYLRRLTKAEPWDCRYDPDMYYRLRRLDDIGFVLPKVIDGNRRLVRILEEFGDESIAVEERKPFNMKDYIKITKDGEEYLELYDQYVSKW